MTDREKEIDEAASAHVWKTFVHPKHEMHKPAVRQFKAGVKWKTRQVQELMDACIILKDDVEFYTGDVRELTAWPRFLAAFKPFEVDYEDELDKEEARNEQAKRAEAEGTGQGGSPST